MTSVWVVRNGLRVETTLDMGLAAQLAATATGLTINAVSGSTSLHTNNDLPVYIGSRLAIGPATNALGSLTLPANASVTTSADTGSLDLYTGTGAGGRIHIDSTGGVIVQAKNAESVVLRTATNAFSLDALAATTSKLKLTGQSADTLAVTGGVTIAGGLVASSSSLGHLLSITATASRSVLDLLNSSTTGYGAIRFTNDNAKQMLVGVGCSLSDIGEQCFVKVPSALNILGAPVVVTDTTPGALVVNGGVAVAGALSVAGAVALTSITSQVFRRENAGAATWMLAGTLTGTSPGRARILVLGCQNYDVASGGQYGGESIVTISINNNNSAPNANGYFSSTRSSLGGGYSINGVKLVQDGTNTWSWKVYFSCNSWNMGSLTVQTSKDLTWTEQLLVGQADPGVASATVQILTQNCASSAAVTLTDTTASTSATTGALVALGGVGVLGAVNMGSTLRAAGIVTLASTTASTSTSTGALVVAGGIGAGGALVAGAACTFSGGVPHALICTGVRDTVAVTNTNTSGFATAAFTNNSGVSMFVGVGGTTASAPYTNRPYILSNAGVSFYGGAVAVTAGVASTSASTGSLVITGGMGVSGSLFCTGAANFTAAAQHSFTSSLSSETLLIRNISPTGLAAVSLVNDNNTAFSIGVGGSALATANKDKAYVNATNGVLLQGGVYAFTGTATATSVSTGAVTVAGGLGVAGALYTASFSSVGDAAITGVLSTTSSVILSGTIAHKITSTGANDTLSLINTNTNGGATISMTNNSGTGMLFGVGGSGLGVNLANRAYLNLPSLGLVVNQGPMLITSNIASTSTGTGSLQVAGGLGVVGAIYSGSVNSGAATVTTLNTTGDVTVTNGLIKSVSTVPSGFSGHTFTNDTGAVLTLGQAGSTAASTPGDPYLQYPSTTTLRIKGNVSVDTNLAVTGDVSAAPRVVRYLAQSQTTNSRSSDVVLWNTTPYTVAFPTSMTGTTWNNEGFNFYPNTLRPILVTVSVCLATTSSTPIYFELCLALNANGVSDGFNTAGKTLQVTSSYGTGLEASLIYVHYPKATSEYLSILWTSSTPVVLTNSQIQRCNFQVQYYR